jgi:Mg2+ and Co2+ transporter CorA
MKNINRLTETDIQRITKKILKENRGMSDDEAIGIFKKLERNGQDIDSVIMKVKRGKDSLNEVLKKHIQRNSATQVFDERQRTPGDVVESVGALNSSLNQLELLISDYKKLIRRSITL